MTRLCPRRSSSVNLSDLPFAPTELAFIAIYILSLLGIGWLGRRAQKERSMQDFYLGGRGVGIFVLLLTLYATQYSGNTLFGYTGKSYRIGFQWTVCVHFMTSILVFYLVFASKLHRLSRQRGYITPTDFLQDRYQSTAVNLLATLIMVVALANYLLAQMKALGEAMRGFVPDHPAFAYTAGVITLALIVVVYESLGGFRAVAWTDVIQGVVLMVGFTVLLFMMFWHFGTLQSATEELLVAQPQKVAPPAGREVVTWFSWIFMVGIGGALYPQAVQRIYAARSARTLRLSLAMMTILPLTTTLVAVLFGAVAAAHIPPIDGTGDQILTVVCREIQQQSLFGRYLIVILLAGVLAALMSTADSVLLSVSSMLTKDIYARHVNRDANEKQLTRAGKWFSWVLIILAVVAAIALRDVDLMVLLKFKFELLAQLGPAIMIGIHWPRLRAAPVFWGMLVGVIVAVTLGLLYDSPPLGIHSGLYGLAVNLLICVGGSGLISNGSHRLSDERLIRKAGK